MKKFDDQENKFITDISNDSQLKLAINPETAIPGKHTVEFTITEKVKSETIESIKEIEVEIVEEGNDKSDQD